MGTDTYIPRLSSKYTGKMHKVKLSRREEPDLLRHFLFLLEIYPSAIAHYILLIRSMKYITLNLYM